MLTNATNKKSNIGWYIAAVVIVVVIIVVGVLSYELTLPSSPSPSASPNATPTSSPSASSSVSPTASGTTIALTLYGGMVSTSTYGFGNSASTITSPGPALNLKVGQTYTMTFYNVATDLPHSWEIVPTKAVGTPMFGAGIGVNSYISPGGSGSVTFTPDQTGNFYYVCTVPGHITLGMWGNVVIAS